MPVTNKESSEENDTAKSVSIGICQYNSRESNDSNAEVDSDSDEEMRGRRLFCGEEHNEDEDSQLKDQSDHVLEMSNALQANMKSLEERNLILSIRSMSSRD